MRTRTTYDKEFKLMAVELLLSGKTAKEVSKDLDIDASLLRRWKLEYKKYGANCFAGNGNLVLKDDEKENLRLKKELREVKLERDILKKAVSIFSKSDGKNSSL